MLEYRERNGNKHIVSDDELKAFAWAGYYANCATILVNGKSYEVVHVFDSEIEFADGTYIPLGCYAIFKDNNELKKLWGNSYSTYYQKIKEAVTSRKFVKQLLLLFIMLYSVC